MSAILTHKQRIDTILKAIRARDFAGAKILTQYKCKYIAEKQAHRVGQIMGALCTDGSDGDADLAVEFLNQFNPTKRT